jgi:hypothetical protein
LDLPAFQSAILEALEEHADDEDGENAPVTVATLGRYLLPYDREDLKGGMRRLLWYAELRAEQAVESVLHRTMARCARRGESNLLANLAAYAGEDSPDVRKLALLLSESMTL